MDESLSQVNAVANANVVEMTTRIKELELQVEQLRASAAGTRMRPTHGVAPDLFAVPG